MKNTENYLALARWFKGGQGFANGQVIDKIGKQTRPVQQGRAYNSTNTTEIINIPYNVAWDVGTGDFTVSVWVRPANNTQQSGIFGGVSSPTNYRSFLIFQGGANFQFYASSNGVIWDIASVINIGTVDVNTWTLLTVVRSGNTFSTYKNNIAGGTVTSALSLYNNPASQIQLLDHQAFVSFQGQSYNYGFWTRAITAAERANQLNSRYNFTNCIAFYKCDEGGGTLCVNSGSLGGLADGIIVNANLANFHTTLTDGFGADWQNQVGCTPSSRFAGNAMTTIADNPFLRFGTGDFTIAFNAVATTFGLNGALGRSIISKTTGATTAGFDIWLNNANSSYTFFTNANIISTGTLSTNVEYHIAFVRQAGVISAYVNGTRVATVANTHDLNTTEILRFGQNVNAGSFFDGWGRNILFARNAIWTGASYTVPQNWNDYQTILANNQVVLFRPNLAIQGENSLFNYTVTHTNTANHLVPRNESNINFDAYGSPLFYSDRVKYNAELRQSNCLTFDGTNDCISIPNSADFNMGSNDFTYIVNFRTPNAFTRDYYLVGQFNSAGQDASTSVGISVRPNGVLRAFIYTTTSFIFETPNNTLQTNTNYTIVIRRTGTVLDILVNSVLVSTFTLNGSINSSTQPLAIGNYTGVLPTTFTTFFYEGLIYGVKIFRNEALTIVNIKNPYYTSANLVLDMPLQEGSGNRVFSKVGGHIGTMNNFDLNTCWTILQNIVHSNLINGFDKSTYFGGTQQLSIANGGLTLGTNDFTIDFWVNVQSNTGLDNVISHNATVLAPFYVVRQGASWRLTIADSSTQTTFLIPVVNANVWQHIAFVRTGGNVYTFSNGTLQNTTANATNVTGSNAVNNWIMGVGSGGLTNFTGHISSLRIFIGRGLWNATFNTNTLTENHYQTETANRVFWLRGIEDFNSPAKAITNTGVVMVRKPIGTITTQPITQSNYSGTWHNEAETTFVIPQAPQLVRRDTFARLFNTGTQIVQTFANMHNISGAKIIRGFQKITPFLHKFDFSIKRFFNQ